MTTDPFARVRPGQPLKLSARQFNALVDAAQWVNQHKNDITGQRTPGSLPAGWCLIRNDSGSDRRRFESLAIDDILISPADNETQFLSKPAVVGKLPTSAHVAAGRIAVLQEPIPKSANGRAVIVGLTPALVTVGDATDPRADLVADSGTLQTGPLGAAKVLYLNSDKGLALICVGHPADQRGVAKAASGIPAIASSTPGSATCEIYRLADDALVATGVEVTIYNSAGEVTAGSFIQFKSDTYGNLWVDVENCS